MFFDVTLLGGTRNTIYHHDGMEVLLRGTAIFADHHAPDNLQVSFQGSEGPWYDLAPGCGVKAEKPPYVNPRVRLRGAALANGTAPWAGFDLEQVYPEQGSQDRQYS